MLFSPRTVRLPFDPSGKARQRAQAAQCFALEPAHDRHARAALEAYADSAAAEMPQLAMWLRSAAAAAPQTGPSHCAATVARVFDLAHAWAATQPDYARMAWEHVRSHLLEALSPKPVPAEEAPPPLETR